MSVEQTAAALVRVRELQEELQASGREDVMKGRCQSYADVSCDIEVRSYLHIPSLRICLLT